MVERFEQPIPHLAGARGNLIAGLEIGHVEHAGFGLRRLLGLVAIFALRYVAPALGMDDDGAGIRVSAGDQLCGQTSGKLNVRVHKPRVSYRETIEKAVEVLLKSVVASPMVKYRGPFVLGMPADAWFDVDMIQKDMRLALDMAHASAVSLPSVALTYELLTAVKGLGLAKFDFAILFDLLAQMANLPPSKKL